MTLASFYMLVMYKLLLKIGENNYERNKIEDWGKESHKEQSLKTAFERERSLRRVEKRIGLDSQVSVLGVKSSGR